MQDSTLGVLSVYIDETDLQIGGRPAVLHAMAVPREIEAASRALQTIRVSYELPDLMEIRWRLEHSDRDTKSQVKESVLHCLVQHFDCMANITSGADRAIAFRNALRQVARYARSNQQARVAVYYDSGGFASDALIQAELEAWTDIRCIALGAMDSRWTVGIQYADMLAGVLRYMILCRFGQATKRLRVFDEGLGQWLEIRLDAMLRLIMRTSLVAAPIHLDPQAESYTMDDLTRDSFGTGLVADGPFTEAELSVLRAFARFYMGCTH